MSEKVTDKPKNGVEKETVITSATSKETGVVDEVERVIERGEAQTISLENIEKGLTVLWQAAAKPRDGEEEQPVMRACVFNLVICVNGDDELSEVTDTIAELTWSYPCRAIVLVRKPEVPESSTNALISAHCQLPTSTGKKVCCEQITVIGTGAAADGLWSLVLPLLVPDLPVLLYWPKELMLEGELFQHLMDTVDRLIVDSRNFDDPSATFAHLAELSKTQFVETALGDLNWSRLAAWRNLLADFFDDAHFLPYLSQVDSVELHYEAPDDNNNPNFSEALLLVGWLGNLLNWQPAFNLQRRGSNATLILNQRGAPLTITLHGHNDRVDELGGITQVQIKASKPGDTEGESHSATFSIQLSDDYDHAMTSVEEDGKVLMKRNVMFPRPSITDLLSQDLALIRRDQYFQSALELAGEFSRQ
ncbi:MAG TPA: glucose-6-phosphate dehydrogenase assembly protein OpcA [Chloroflexia bacterium]|nr:glucose-6-phosphate dehydrogenase assembly protein OpcA [Chloroflexia bacterium]